MVVAVLASKTLKAAYLQHLRKLRSLKLYFRKGIHLAIQCHLELERWQTNHGEKVNVSLKCFMFNCSEVTVITNKSKLSNILPVLFIT